MVRLSFGHRLLFVAGFLVLVLIECTGLCAAFSPPGRDGRDRDDGRQVARARRKARSRDRLLPAPVPAAFAADVITTVVVEAEAPVHSYADRWIQQALDDAGYQHTISYWLTASLEERGDHPDRCFPLPEWIRDMDHAHVLEITPRCGIDWRETMPFELRFEQMNEDDDGECEDRWWERFLPDRRIEIGSRGNRTGSNIVMPNPPRPLKWGKQLLRFEIEY